MKRHSHFYLDWPNLRSLTVWTKLELNSNYNEDTNVSSKLTAVTVKSKTSNLWTFILSHHHTKVGTCKIVRSSWPKHLLHSFDILLYCYKRDFMKQLQSDSRYDTLYGSDCTYNYMYLSLFIWGTSFALTALNMKYLPTILGSAIYVLACTVCTCPVNLHPDI